MPGDVVSLNVAPLPLVSGVGAVSDEQVLPCTDQVRGGAAQLAACEVVQAGVPTIDRVPFEHDQVTLPVVGLPVSFKVIDWLFDNAGGVESAEQLLSPLDQVAEGGAQLPGAPVHDGLPTMDKAPLLQR